MLVLIAVFVSTTILTTVEGTAFNESNTRILKGTMALPGDFTYMASVRDSKFQHICGGAILNAYWILTAAQCTNSVYVGFGNFLLTFQFLYQVEKSVVHPKYSSSNFQNDLKLLKVYFPIPIIGGIIDKIGVNSDTSVDTQIILTQVPGWGKTSTTTAGTSSENMYSMGYYINPPLICGVKNFIVNPSVAFSTTLQICADTKVPTGGICDGDIGSPMVYSGNIVGVTSRVMKPPCGALNPDVFTRVSQYATWIAQTAVV